MTLDFATFNNSWGMFNQHFNTNNITCEEFIARVNSAEYHRMKISDFFEIENCETTRLVARSAEYAYRDNPRGNDVHVVNTLMGMLADNRPLSPIMVAKTNDRTILLDGMHRLVAHALGRKRKILVCVVKI